MMLPATLPDDAPHLLVVDDDRRIRDLLSRFLASEGYRVTTAETAADARGEHQDRHVGGAADRLGEIEAGLARHHHVENEQIETQTVELGARVGRGLGRGHAVALAGQEARQQVADAAVVIDHQQMRRIVGKRGGQYHLLLTCHFNPAPWRARRA